MTTKKALTSNSQAMGDLIKALGLPEYTVSFEMKAGVGKLVEVRVEYLAPEAMAIDLIKLLKTYHLVPVEGENA